MGVRKIGKHDPARGRLVPKRLAVIGIVGAVLVASVITAFALLSASDSVENTLHAASAVNPTITETFDKNEKTDVKVNVGDPGYAVYVRAAVVVNWQNAAGEVLGSAPVEGTDYTIDINKTDWFERDGFYYCKQPISAGETPILIKSCKPIASAPENGYTLNVQILSQTVQALGTTDADDTPAVIDAWEDRITIDASGNLSLS